MYWDLEVAHVAESRDVKNTVMPGFMALSCRRACPFSSKFYSTSPVQKPPLKLVAELRKLTDVTITKAREALSENANDIEASLEWLQKNLAATGAKAAARLERRETKQGLITLSILAGGNGMKNGWGEGRLRAAMVELNCETDFVGRNALFGKLAANIAHTAAFISDPSDSDKLFRPCSLDLLNDAPLISQIDPQSHHSLTVGSAIRDLIAKVGEKISLRRATVVVQNPPSSTELAIRLASYSHGSVNLPCEGRIGVLAILAMKSRRLPSLLSSKPFLEDLEHLERSLARQITGFDTRTIRSPPGTTDETALYDQPFMMLPGDSSGQPVHAVLHEWAQKRGVVEAGQADGGLNVLEFEKWIVGDCSDVH